MDMVNTTSNSSEDMIIKLQPRKGKTKLKFHTNISIYYDEMNIKVLNLNEMSFLKLQKELVKLIMKY